MKPRMKFYSNGDRVQSGNEIIRYELLEYIIQLNRGLGFKLNADIMIPSVTDPNTGIVKYIKAP